MLQLFEIRMPRRILTPKVDEVSEHWRRLHLEQLHDLLLLTKYCSGDHIKKN
jgi:hypothetical protein